MPADAADCTIVVPTYNMGRFLTPLFDSIVNSPLAGSIAEMIFVSDGSTDDTDEVVRALATRGAPFAVRLLKPERNAGTFRARYLGATNAQSKTLMFIDSRITLPLATAVALKSLMGQAPALVANCDVDPHKNIYCLYWRRSHARFYRSEALAEVPVTIDALNFDRIPFGSTCFICPRDAFVEASARFLDHTLWSDDTLLFSDMVQTTPFVLHPQFRIDWEPRDRLYPFLKRLFDRGPGLAQYHFFKVRGALFYATLIASTYGALSLGLAFWCPAWSAGLIVGALLATFASTILIAHGPREFFRLAPLHVAVIAAYGLGALRGAWVVWRRRY